VGGQAFWRQKVTLHIAQRNPTEARVAFERSRRVLAPKGVGIAGLALSDWLEACIEQLEGNHTGARSRLETIISKISTSPDRNMLLQWEAKLQEAFGVSLAALGQPAEAQRSLEAALQINKAIFDPKASISVGRVALRLAGLHKAAGRAAVAKAYQAQADAIRRTHPLFEQWVF
ncbi:MAG: hypothetical protein WCH60_20505, partial [Burkholderiales bacterium]